MEGSCKISVQTLYIAIHWRFRQTSWRKGTIQRKYRMQNRLHGGYIEFWCDPTVIVLGRMVALVVLDAEIDERNSDCMKRTVVRRHRPVLATVVRPVVSEQECDAMSRLCRLQDFSK